MRPHRFEKEIAWSPCCSKGPRWMNPLAGLCSRTRVTATCVRKVASELAADDNIGSSRKKNPCVLRCCPIACSCVGAVWWVSRRLDVTKDLRSLDVEFALPDDI